MNTRKLELEWLLPSAINADASARRSTRDWVVDVLCFVFGAGGALIITVDLLQPEPSSLTGWRDSPTWLIWLDFGVAMVATIGLWFRRGRGLVVLAAFCLVISTFSLAIAFTGLIILFTVAVYQPFPVTATYAVAVIAADAIFLAVRPERPPTFVESIAWTTAMILIITLWGMVIRSRRQLVLSLRDRAERAENEQQLRVTQARVLERTRIAREMHDVLAHRISLLSLHAGALEIKTDATPEQVSKAAGVIRSSAHQALQDLREVIGVLREDRPAHEADPERPQPTLSALPALVDESRSAGVKVRLDVRIEPATVPDGTGRTAYRIVQEGLTNARKHAPGAVVKVTVAGAAGEGLTVDIRNPRPLSGAASPIPGSGTGLIGLAERTTLAGGRLTRGPAAGDEFVLTAWLPWPE